MTTIMIELTDTLVVQAQQAGLRVPQAVADLLAGAADNLDNAQFQDETRASVAQADQPDAQWLTHAQVAAEWSRERAALLAGRPLPGTDIL